MNKLLELYLQTRDVSFDEIPDEWRKSFDEFMFGQACAILNGKPMAYSHDYKRWFNINEKSIMREIKIDAIIKHKKSPN